MSAARVHLDQLRMRTSTSDGSERVWYERATGRAADGRSQTSSQQQAYEKSTSDGNEEQDRQAEATSKDLHETKAAQRRETEAAERWCRSRRSGSQRRCDAHAKSGPLVQSQAAQIQLDWT